MSTSPRFSSRAALVVTTAVVASLAGATVSGALAGDGPAGVIHACVKDANGQVRVVDDGDPCDPSEHPLQWAAEPPGSSALTMVAGIITPEGEIAFGEPFGGSDFTVGHPATGLYTIDIAPSTFPGVRCPVTVAQSWFTDAYMKVTGWVCDPSGYHVTFATSTGEDAGFWFQTTQIDDELG
jgi:hypothetical protein